MDKYANLISPIKLFYFIDQVYPIYRVSESKCMKFWSDCF